MRRLFKNLFRRDNYDTSGVLQTENPFRGDPVLTFKIHNAVGGKVVEFYSYDHMKNRSDSHIYIIRDDEDFGDAIKNIAITHRLATGKF